MKIIQPSSTLSSNPNSKITSIMDETILAHALTINEQSTTTLMKIIQPTSTLSSNPNIKSTSIMDERILAHALSINEQSTTTLSKIIPTTSTLSSNPNSKITSIMFELIITSTLHETQHSNPPINSYNLLKLNSEIGPIQNNTLDQTQNIIGIKHSNYTFTYIFVIVIVSFVIILTIILTLFFWKPKQSIPKVKDDIDLNTFVTNFVQNTNTFQTLENVENNVSKHLPNDFESIDLN